MNRNSMKGNGAVRAALLVAACLGGSSAWAQSYTTFLNNGPSSNRVDMVFLGDGYTASQGATYQTHIDSMMNHMFAEMEDPYPRYKNFFNGHKVNLVSAQSGADDPSAGHYVNTALDASYRWDGYTQRLLYVNENKANAAINAALAGAGFSAEVRPVTVNATQYGGGGGRYAVYAGGNSAATEVALHELGHSFNGLADEYFYNGATYTGNEPNQPNITTDPSGSKWSQWTGYYQPGIGTIGAYQGGGYYDYGIYRPSQNSKMRELGRPFDAVAREKIILDIYDLVDPLDGWTNNMNLLIDPTEIMVDVVDSNVISTEWYVDGALVSGATGTTFDARDYGFGPGAYSIRSRSFDPTDWVRIDRDKLEQSIVWNVTYSAVPEPGTMAVLSMGGLALLRRRRRR